MALCICLLEQGTGGERPADVPAGDRPGNDALAAMLASLREDRGDAVSRPGPRPSQPFFRKSATWSPKTMLAATETMEEGRRASVLSMATEVAAKLVSWGKPPTATRSHQFKRSGADATLVTPTKEDTSFSSTSSEEGGEDWSGREGSKRTMSFNLSVSSGRSGRPQRSKPRAIATVDAGVQTEVWSEDMQPGWLRECKPKRAVATGTQTEGGAATRQQQPTQTEGEDHPCLRVDSHESGGRGGGSTPPSTSRPPLLGRAGARSRSRSPLESRWETSNCRGRAWSGESQGQGKSKERALSCDSLAGDCEEKGEIPETGPGSLDGLWVLEDSVPQAAAWLQCLKILGDEVTDALGTVHQLTWKRGVADLAGGMTCRRAGQICRLGKTGSVQIFARFTLPTPPADPTPVALPSPSQRPQGSGVLQSSGSGGGLGGGGTALKGHL